MLAAVGAARALPAGAPPPARLTELVTPHLLPGGTFAVARSTHQGRYAVLLLDGIGQPDAIAKLALDEVGVKALEAESESLARLRGWLPPGLGAPDVRAQEHGVLVFELVPWRPQARPWRLPPQVALDIGRFYRAGVRPDGRGPSHGDCAPWNLLHGAGRWFLIDWADARPDAPPFTDVLHYLVQSHALLGRPGLRALLRAFDGDTGWAGRALQAYAEGAGLAVGDAAPALRGYLLASLASPGSGDPGGSRGWRARRRLLAAVEAGSVGKDRG